MNVPMPMHTWTLEAARSGRRPHLAQIDDPGERRRESRRRLVRRQHRALPQARQGDELGEELDVQRPNLLKTAYLVDFVATSDCGDGPLDRPGRAYSTVEYEYQSLSDYLLDRLSE